MHTIFYFFSYSIAIQTIKDIKVYFSFNESYNEVQGIESIILWTSSFFTNFHNNKYIIISALTRGKLMSAA